MKYETYCPLFPGFYGTVFEPDCEDNEISGYNEENGTDYGYDDFNWDYTEYENRIAKSFVNRVERELKQFLPIKIEFQNIHSPKEYNFTNDSINVIISLSLDKLIKLIRDRSAAASEYFKSTYTSCSGFISFHSSNINDWLNKKYILDDPAHRIGSLLNCLCFCEINRDDAAYWCDDETGYISYSLKEQETID
jgi:hypothetical protein